MLGGLLQAKEERMVEHDVLALEGRRLKGSLVSAAQDVAGLENRKAQLHFSMEERKQEIQVPSCLLALPKPVQLQFCAV